MKKTKGVKNYTKKPVRVKAIRWDGENTDDVQEFIGKRVPKQYSAIEKDKVVAMFINTLEGEMAVSIGDYIVKGVMGEHYPVKPEIFELTYRHDEN